MERVPFLTVSPIDVDALEERARRMETGAVISFQGVVRPDRTAQGEVVGLDFHAYEAMAEDEMGRILEDLQVRWPDSQALWQHRLGTVPVGETSLLLVVSAPHNAQAFAACHFALDQMKTRVPIWKKDVFQDGSTRWSGEHRETLLISDSVLTYPPS